jgi:hypothetical protein
VFRATDAAASEYWAGGQAKPNGIEYIFIALRRADPSASERATSRQKSNIDSWQFSQEIFAQ